MKILMVICLGAMVLFGAEITSLKDIRAEYAKVKSELKSYKKSKKTLEDVSTEGGEADVYRDSNGKIRFIQAQIYGEMGRNVEEYYYKNGSLFFVYEVRYDYNAPMYAEGEFDDKKTKASRNRYYFVNNKMVKWVDGSKSEVSKRDKKFANKEKIISEFSKELLSVK